MRPLIRLIPPFLVRLFARPYVAGDSLEAAVATALELWRDQGLVTTLDLLAEDIDSREVAEANVATYLAMIDAVSAESGFGTGRDRPTLSLKLSSYTASPLDRGGDAAGAADAVRRICAHAATRDVGLSLDMEDHHWTDFSLDLLAELHAEGHRHIGAVLQTRLHRTEADLGRLPAGIRVRLVIGIYAEPAEIALVDKRAMKERMLEYASRLLNRGHYVEFATHDEPYVRRFVDSVSTSHGSDAFEIQMLYGVPRAKLLGQLRARGIRARLYVPFALGWPMAIAYLRRRLDEYPAMMWMVAKNLLRRR